LTICCNSFTIEKFIIGIKRLDLIDPIKKIKQIFKVYSPAVAKSILYDCEPMQEAMDVSVG